MNIINDTISVVINGDWNRYFLSPDWLAKNIFDKQQIEAEMAFNGIGTILRFNCDDVSVTPSMSQMTFICRKNSDEAIKKLEHRVSNFMKNAPSPLITTYGYNISFEERDSSNINATFDKIPDSINLIKHGAIIQSCTLHRTIELNEKTLEYVLYSNKSDTNFSFNWNIIFNKSNDQFEVIQDKIVNLKKECIEFLENCYGQKYKEENGDN